MKKIDQIRDQIRKHKDSEDCGNSKYNTVYESSSIEKTKAILGTIESDSSGLFGRHEKEEFRGRKIFDILCKEEFSSVLDVGAGKLEATSEFIKKDKVVDIVDFSESFYLKQSDNKVLREINKVYIGDFNYLDIEKKYDCIWAAHVLEHQLNPNIFLKKINSCLKEGGFLALVVPPRKPFVVGGHVGMWNGGLLIYHLVLAGFDCSKIIKLKQYDYNIGIIIKKKTIKNLPDVNFDIGDIEILKKFFPLNVTDGFNGDIMEI